MLEILLILIIIIGIFILSFSNFKDSRLELAREQLIAHLNHTRFLALNSAKQITQAAFCQSNLCEIERKNYEESFWRLQFALLQDIGFSYSIFSDIARLTPQSTLHFDDRPRNKEEVAIGFLDNKYLSVYSISNSKYANTLRDGDLSLTKRYGVMGVQMSGGCGVDLAGARILFDESGFLKCKQPLQSVAAPKGAVEILLKGKTKELKICILESGFVKKC